MGVCMILPLHIVMQRPSGLKGVTCVCIAAFLLNFLNFFVCFRSTHPVDGAGGIMFCPSTHA